MGGVVGCLSVVAWTMGRAPLIAWRGTSERSGSSGGSREPDGARGREGPRTGAREDPARAAAHPRAGGPGSGGAPARHARPPAAREIADTVLLYADPEDASELSRLAGSDARLLLQEGRGLADALRLGMARHIAKGPVALVSSDIPGIPPGSLEGAFAALDDGADVVLGPALDGGYWLIAMRDFSDAPFRSIPWSTPAVFAVTVRRCEQAGLAVTVLEPWRDVDTPVDLAFMLTQIDELPAPRTAGVLRELAAEEAVPPTARACGSTRASS